MLEYFTKYANLEIPRFREPTDRFGIEIYLPEFLINVPGMTHGQDKQGVYRDGDGADRAFATWANLWQGVYVREMRVRTGPLMDAV